MGSRSASAGAILLALAAAGPTPAEAQRPIELGAIAVGTASDPALAAAGLYGALRTSLRTRLSAMAGLGASGGEVAWRGELLAHFLLNPTRRHGTGVYGAGGLAWSGGPIDEGFVVVTLGLEAQPGAASGWFAEAGVGGGARLAVGYRWRRLPEGWAER